MICDDIFQPQHVGYGCQGPYIWDMVVRAPIYGIWLAGPQPVGYGWQGPNMLDMVVRAPTCGTWLSGPQHVGYYGRWQILLVFLVADGFLDACGRIGPWVAHLYIVAVLVVSITDLSLVDWGTWLPDWTFGCNIKQFCFIFIQSGLTFFIHGYCDFYRKKLLLHWLIPFYSKVSHAYTISKLSYIKLNLLNFIHWFLQILCFFYS